MFKGSIACGVQLPAAFNVQGFKGSISCGVQLPAAFNVQGFNCLRRSMFKGSWVQFPVAFNCLRR
jgi:hypothetical protein